MCDLNRKTNKKSVVGYKFVIKHDGGYYSPATGMRYEIGLIKPVTVFGEVRADIFNDSLLTPGSFCFSEGLVGRTAVFNSFASCELFINRSARVISDMFDTCIIKMKLSNDLIGGTYSHSDVTAGRTIDLIEEVKINI